MSLEDRLYPWLNLYERLPEGLRCTLGRGYRLLPKRWRWGRRYGEFERLASEGESWDLEEVRAYQLRQLRLTLHHAASTCPYYEREFTRSGFRPEYVQSLEDLRHCPTLTKGDLQRHETEVISSAVKTSQCLRVTTGGSTGQPVGLRLQKGVSRPKEQAFLEAMWRRAGYHAGARLAVLRGHVTTDQSHGRISRYDATRDWLMLSSSHLTDERLPEYLEAIENFRPDFLHAYPSAALQLAEFLERESQGWRTRLRGLLCGSEQLTLPQKRLLERVFQCRVYRWYGHTERVVLAGEGRDSELFYFWPQYGLVDFGPRNDQGLCEVIGTSFHNLAMPLIRYRTGDYVRVAEATDPENLEFPWQAAVEIAGREQEFLVSRGGRRISLTAFNMHDRIFDDLYALQFLQEEPGVAELRYVAGPGFQTTRLPKIKERVSQKLGDDFRVTLREVREVERTARGKHRWLISRLESV